MDIPDPQDWLHDGEVIVIEDNVGGHINSSNSHGKCNISFLQSSSIIGSIISSNCDNLLNSMASMTMTR